MLCQSCKKHQATVHQLDLQYVDSAPGELRILHLCPPCAKQRGIPVPGNVPSFPQVVGMLGKAFLGMQGLAAQKGAPEASCKHCGWTMADFRRSSRFGCSEDYEVFSDFVDQILDRLHGNTEHPLPPQETRLVELSQEMNQAIGREDYETAARLRDSIHELEESLESPDNLDF